MNAPEEATPQTGQNQHSRLRRFFAPRARTWGLAIPIHLVAFTLFYLATDRLLQSEVVETATRAAEEQLTQAAEELQVVARAHTGDASGGHIFAALLEAYDDIDFRLFIMGGGVIGLDEPLTEQEHLEMVNFLASNEEQQFWLNEDEGKTEMRGLMTVVATQHCFPCHEPGQTLAAASMTKDLTAQIQTVRAHSRRNLALLITLWAVVLGGTQLIVRRSIKRSAARLEADLAAAEAGDAGPTDSGPLVLDAASARLHQSLRDFLQRQRERDAEVATRLEHTDRLASLGRLAAGLAHEIKNPLAGIQGALEILREDLTEQESSKLCDEMLSELERVNQTLQSLLASARPTPAQLSDTDVEQLLEDLRRLVEPGFRRRNITLDLDIAADVPKAQLDAAKMRQVLLNLVNNAADAMDGGGHITLRAGSFPDRQDLILAVQDDGPGISEENQVKIFEPFFTTKFTGTGLGLAIARSLVEQHGGSLELETVPGEGTTFFIFLPTIARVQPPPTDMISSE
ncbi:MAG: hypothetical protein EP299_10995 [Acidobacteria bacterium]|nr:MAG: hypothetical protein EP299_10995 [Acidobacteriota bacterium]